MIYSHVFHQSILGLQLFSALFAFEGLVRVDSLNMSLQNSFTSKCLSTLFTDIVISISPLVDIPDVRLEQILVLEKLAT